MTPDQLITFAAVAEHRNISRAAIALHLSQPAVSGQLRQLQDEFGEALYPRAVAGGGAVPGPDCGGCNLIGAELQPVAKPEFARRRRKGPDACRGHVSLFQGFPLWRHGSLSKQYVVVKALGRFF